MLSMKGRLVYDPPRGSDFKKTFKQRTLIVELPRDQLDLYYQWFLKKRLGSWIELQRPMYGLHVTVVKGNESIPKEKLYLWKKYEGETVRVLYDPAKLERHWQFWSLDVESQRLSDLRKELGLFSFHRFHLTIGRQHDWQPQIEVPLPLGGLHAP